ncbi:hypothetical protein ACS0ZG_35630 [Burkholderia gladioli]|uniref:hypothetical protein n=1 Tax=Burkholderia TaxID=32008 RepID=UPI0021512469|nr:hypothetical protein [Burkholderia glumae]UVS82819.1 hypothetical protein EFP18_00670 [Burkholderia glumae]
MIRELVARFDLDHAAGLIAIAAVRIAGKVITLADTAVPRREFEPGEDDSKDKPEGSGSVLALPVEELLLPEPPG